MFEMDGNTAFYKVEKQNIVMCIPNAGQWVGKHIPATQGHTTIEGYPLLGNGPVNKHS
jgi:hypothetical protein